ncbi:PREDICTED: CD151 antigen-like [Nicrophorus vespilloides]|uniref:Tetraspanin n=1 Tax=Nicrophorus vespilloides TaxID=110193 RepID=A0ABM1MZH6_NICVS|nr:PREDICTED: CD151 antigen-like [Nicrophorus vespilloides]
MATARARRRDDGCCSANFLKYVLHIYNVFFMVAGLLVLGTAIWVLLDKYKYVALLTTATYPIITYFLLAAGGLVLVVTIIGFCAVSKENRPLLLLYIFCLLLIFLIEAMVGILAYIYQEQVHDELVLNLNGTLNANYGINEDKTAAIDFLQDSFDCCGAGNYMDWESSRWRMENKSGINIVPDSCCKTITVNCGKRTHPSNINYSGCLDRMEDHMKGHLIILSAVGLGICVLQIFGIVYAFSLYCKLKDFTDVHL